MRSGYLDRIAAALGLTKNQLSVYCDTIRAVASRRVTASNRDIAQVLQELIAQNPSLAQSVQKLTTVSVEPAAAVEHARLIAEALRARNRGVAARVDALRGIGKRPTSYGRCSCGAPAIPGESVCYTCSS